MKLNLANLAEQLRRFPGSLEGVRKVGLLLPSARTLRRIKAGGWRVEIETLNSLLDAGVIGNALMILRIEQGKMSGVNFAEKLGMSKQHLSNVLHCNGGRQADAILEKLGYEVVEIWQKKKTND